MRFLKLSLTLAFACPVYAEEEGGGKIMQPLPKEEREFFEKKQKLNSLTTRIDEDEKQFMNLVRKKAAEKDTVEKQRIINQMNEVTKDRNKSTEEYNRVKSDLLLRYPNEGEHLNRQYRTQIKKSVQELEGAAGLDELLTRTKKLVERKYAPFADPKDKSADKPKVAKPEAEKEERLKLEK